MLFYGKSIPLKQKIFRLFRVRLARLKPCQPKNRLNKMKIPIQLNLGTEQSHRYIQTLQVAKRYGSGYKPEPSGSNL